MKNFFRQRAAAGRVQLRKRRPLVIAAALLATLLFLLARAGESAWQASAAEPAFRTSNQAGVALGNPDAIIRSQSLRDLPKDLLRVPLLASVLTEDLLFYYDNDEDWLGLKGTLRRIAYEHELDLGDSLVALLLDRPAEVYLWRDAQGAPRHFAVSLERDVLVAVAEKLARVAASGDRQLTVLGQVSVNGHDAPVYQLALSPRRSFVFTLQGERLVLFSSPALVQDNAGQLDAGFIAAVTHWLAPQEKDRLALFTGYRLDESKAGSQSLLLSTRLLTLGYSSFFPAFKALRFDFDGKAWNTAGLFDLGGQQPASVFAAGIWQHMPVNPALCVMVPANWLAMKNLLPGGKGFNRKAALTLIDNLNPSGAVCWYDSAGLAEPLFVASLKKSPDAKFDKSLTTLFDWGAGRSDPPGSSADSFSQDLARLQAAALTVTAGKDSFVVRRKMPVVDEIHNPTLARAGNTLFFSVNAELVAQALSVQARQYPSAAESMGSGKNTLLLHIDTQQLAPMLGAEVSRTSTSGSRDTDIIDARLAPRLKAMATHGQLAMTVAPRALKPDLLGWKPLDWQVRR